MACKVRLQLLVFSLYFVVSTQANFGQFFSDVSSCLNVCSKNFSSNEKSLNACRRGCRLFYVCKFSHSLQPLNDTNIECFNVCHEAYTNTTADESACKLGCSSALPLAEQREKEKVEESEEPRVHLLYPLMYVHGLYSNMIHRVYRQMSVSWSFYMQRDNGNVIVMRSKPKVYVEYRGIGSDGDEYHTSNYLETNIESGNNVATPQLKNSQLLAISSQNDDEDDEIGILRDANGQNADWLSCLSFKFGLPRILLTALVLFCAVVMIWLCLTAAVTAPEHRVHTLPPKLSIYGDLDYLIDFEQKKMKKCLPQDIVVASPLPVDIKSDRI
ncbi:transmembrane protein 59-like [Argonauta hians]